MQLVIESVIPLVVNLVGANIALSNGNSPEGPVKILIFEGDGMVFRVPLKEKACEQVAAGLRGIQLPTPPIELPT